MIRRIFTALRVRRARAKTALAQATYQRGWDHALHELDNCVDTSERIKALERCVARERTMGTYDDFDRGVEGGIRYHDELAHRCAERSALIRPLFAAVQPAAAPVRRAAPTNAELHQVMCDCLTAPGADDQVLDHFAFARAVLARWGGADGLAKVGEVQSMHELNDPWLQVLPVGTPVYAAMAGEVRL